MVSTTTRIWIGNYNWRACKRFILESDSLSERRESQATCADWPAAKKSMTREGYYLVKSKYRLNSDNQNMRKKYNWLIYSRIILLNGEKTFTVENQPILTYYRKVDHPLYCQSFFNNNIVDHYDAIWNRHKKYNIQNFFIILQNNIFAFKSVLY